jgi:hypothetical protein
VAALDRVSGAAVAVTEFVVSQVRCEVDVSWHAPVLQLHAATPYDLAPPSRGAACHLNEFSQHAETTTYDALFAWLFALPGPFASSGLMGIVTGWAALSMLLLLLAFLAPSRSELLPALGS